MATTDQATDGSSSIRLTMLSGSFEYDSETSLKRFRDYLEPVETLRINLITYRSEDDDQSLASLDDTDVLLVFTRRLNTTGVELARLRAYCAAGKPVLGVRTASHGFQNWLDFDRLVLGGDYNMHWKHGPLAHVKVEPRSEEHPVMDGVSEFSSLGSLYRNANIAEDADLLMTSHADDHSEPVTWTRLHRGGRVFYTSLGHQQDFDDANFLKLLSNAVLWCGGRT